MSIRARSSTAAAADPGLLPSDFGGGGGGGGGAIPLNRFAIGSGPGLTSYPDATLVDATKAVQIGGTASAANAVGLGGGTATAVSSFASGANASATDPADGLSGVAIGNACSTNQGGGVALGAQSTANGTPGNGGTIAIGAFCGADGGGAIAIGIACTASGDGSVCIGDDSSATGTSASGVGAVSIGWVNATAGIATVAIGRFNRCDAEAAVVIGEENVGNDLGAVAIGFTNTTDGIGSVAIGSTTTANGDGAVAIGDSTEATGDGCIAIGDGAVATGDNAIALGSAAANADVTLATGSCMANQAGGRVHGFNGNLYEIVIYGTTPGAATDETTNLGLIESADFTTDLFSLAEFIGQTISILVEIQVSSAVTTIGQQSFAQRILVTMDGSGTPTKVGTGTQEKFGSTDGSTWTMVLDVDAGSKTLLVTLDTHSEQAALVAGGRVSFTVLTNGL